MRTISLLLAATMFTAGCSVIGWGCGFYGNALQTAKKEFYPDALLKKYEWFKDAAAMLDKKAADIQVYQTRLKSIQDAYGVPSKTNMWPRDVREQSAVWASELAGIKASYNSLAAEYNSQMAKENWDFANVGKVPEGGKPLPREYRTYVTD